MRPLTHNSLLHTVPSYCTLLFIRRPFLLRIHSYSEPPAFDIALSFRSRRRLGCFIAFSVFSGISRENLKSVALRLRLITNYQDASIRVATETFTGISELIFKSIVHAYQGTFQPYPP